MLLLYFVHHLAYKRGTKICPLSYLLSFSLYPNMAGFVRAIFALTIFVSSTLADNTCPGGYPEGTTVDQGAYWYECHSGEMVPKGCLIDDHRARVSIGDTYHSSPHVLQCALDSSGGPTVIYKSCSRGGIERGIGQQWEDGRGVYKCDKDGQFPRIVTVGCADGGRTVGLEEKVSRDGVVYKCRLNSNGDPTLTRWGCVGHDGTQYAIGDKFDYQKYALICMANTDKVYLDYVGCVHDQSRLSANDMLTKDDVVYKCNVDGEKTGMVPFACIAYEDGQKVHKPLGCFWFEGEAPFLYQMTCKQDGPNGVTKVRTKCVYKVTQGAFAVEPGCYQVAGDTAVGCTRDIETRLFQVDSNGNANVPAGFAKC